MVGQLSPPKSMAEDCKIQPKNQTYRICTQIQEWTYESRTKQNSPINTYFPRALGRAPTQAEV